MLIDLENGRDKMLNFHIGLDHDSVLKKFVFFILQKAIDSYAKKIKELSNSAYLGNEDARNAIRLSTFLRGLKPEIRKEIRRQTQNILTLESAEHGNIVAAVQQVTETFRHWNRNRDGVQDHSNQRHYSRSPLRRYNLPT